MSYVEPMLIIYIGSNNTPPTPPTPPISPTPPTSTTPNQLKMSLKYRYLVEADYYITYQILNMHFYFPISSAQ